MRLYCLDVRGYAGPMPMHNSITIIVGARPIFTSPLAGHLCQQLTQGYQRAFSAACTHQKWVISFSTDIDFQIQALGRE